MLAVQSAMQSLTVRRRQLADNIANVQTPGYQAGRVDFEGMLTAAINSGDPSDAKYTTYRSASPSRLDGNNVNLDEEIVGLQDTDLRYQTMVEAMSSKFRMLRTAINGGR